MNTKVLGWAAVLASGALLSSLAAPALGQGEIQATLVQTIDTSGFTPPSPDPTGIAYVPGAGSFLISDSEVNEIPELFLGFNLFWMTPSGAMDGAASTTPFSDEPTGVAYDPQSGRCYFSDDTSASSIYVVDPGPDGACGTADDLVSSFETGPFGSTDPEGIAFAEGSLFIADAFDSEVFEVMPGPNGVFDGIPPTGDDEVVSFDTEALGILRPQGIEYDPDTGNLYLVGQPQSLVAEVTPAGQLVRTIDVSAAGANQPSGLALGPASTHPDAVHLWLVARGVDNGVDPTENDGKVYELSLPPFDLGITMSGAGNVVVSPGEGPYEPGTVVTLTAQPDSELDFVGWGGALDGNLNPATLTMDDDKLVTAKFGDLPDCRDGRDNDGDGLVDRDDPACPNPFSIENTYCNDGIDNDGDGLTDFPEDPNCTSPADWSEACGLGFELVLLLPPLMALRVRARRRPSR